MQPNLTAAAGNRYSYQCGKNAEKKDIDQVAKRRALCLTF